MNLGQILRYKGAKMRNLEKMFNARQIGAKVIKYICRNGLVLLHLRVNQVDILAIVRHHTNDIIVVNSMLLQESFVTKGTTAAEKIVAVLKNA